MINEVRQAHPEPVAWQHESKECSLGSAGMHSIISDQVKQLWLKANPRQVEHYTRALYAAPPVQPAPALPRAMAWGRLYEAINKVVVQIGRDGEVCSRHACVEWLQECLHEIDGGQYMPGLMPGQPAPALSMKRDEWRTLSPEAQAKLERITGAEHPDTKRAKAQAAENVRNVPLGAVQPAPVPPSSPHRPPTDEEVRLWFAGKRSGDFAGSQEYAPAAREADSRSLLEDAASDIDSLLDFVAESNAIRMVGGREAWDAARATLDKIDAYLAAPSGVPQDSARGDHE
jgi:hypothetical protein